MRQELLERVALDVLSGEGNQVRSGENLVAD